MEGGGNGNYQSYHKLPRSSSGSGLMVPVRGGGNLHADGMPANDHLTPGQAPASQTGAPAERQGSGSMVREQDRFMPIANVIRIMRKVLPTHAKISDDAKETIQECVSEYISFITSEANERCQQEQRKTITAEDVLWAMSKLGFDDYIEPLSMYLQRYREIEGDHRGSIRGENLPPIKRSASADTSGHLYGPPQGCTLLPHHHPHYHPAMFGAGGLMGGGGYYRGDLSGGGAGPSQAPPSLPMMPPPNPHLPPHSIPPFDPFASGSYK